MNKLKLLTGKLNCEQKMCIIKGTVWNVAVYATETWTLTKARKNICKRLEHRYGGGCLKSVGWRR